MDLSDFTLISPSPEAVSVDTFDYNFESEGIDVGISVGRGEIAGYEVSDNGAKICHGAVTLTMPLESFEARYSKLPSAPDDLFYYSLDDFMSAEPEEYTILNLKTMVFFKVGGSTPEQALAGNIAGAIFGFDNYGSSWIALGEQ